MSGRTSFLPHPGEALGLPPAFAALHTPRLNQLLAALPQPDYERLLPYLEPVALPRGSTIHGPGDPEKYLHFLTGGLVCRFHVTSDGAFTGFAVTGSEGVIGVASFLGGDSMLSQAVVLCEGHAYRLEADRLKAELEHHGSLAHLLMRYTQALIVQTGQVAVCNRHHLLKQRMCCWILSCLDRLASDELPLTQEVIAEMVGVRRESITGAIGGLQREKLIQCHRGGISVLDRPRLEAQACECYSAVKRESARLLGESGYIPRERLTCTS